MKVVSGVDGFEDANQIVQLLEGIDWNRVPRRNSTRMSLSGNGSVGQSGDVGDIVWVNPHEWRIITESEAKRQQSRAYVGGSPFRRVHRYRLREGWDTQPKTFNRDSGAGTTSNFQDGAAIVSHVAIATAPYADLAIPSQANTVTASQSVTATVHQAVSAITHLEAMPEPEAETDQVDLLEKDTIVLVPPASEAPAAMSGDAHSEDDVQKMAQPLIVDPLDQESTDEDEIVTAPREEFKKSVEAIPISSDSEPETGRKPSSKERRGRKRRDGRSFRI